MLSITIKGNELFDETKQEFIYTKEQTISLEHSLVSVSKWESKWCKPFLSKDEKTIEQTLDYIRCMTITQNVDSNIYNNLSQKTIDEIQRYIEASMTATNINNKGGGNNREIITSEIIYYWMIAFNIPFDCQKWHLNRLLTFINVCQIKNSPSRKMSKKELAARNAELNAQRRLQLNSKG
jgi:hypothetical protein